MNILRNKKNNYIVLKISRRTIFIVLAIIVFFIVSFFLYTFVHKQEKLKEIALANKIAQQGEKNDVYWRKLGDEKFVKMRKMVDTKKEISGEDGKIFQDDIGNALSYFKKAKELNPNNYDNLLSLAQFYDFLIPYVSGAEKDASSYYLLLIKKFPMNYDVMRKAVRVLIINSDKAAVLGDNESANNSLKLAAELSNNLSKNDPINLYGQYYGALIARRQNNFDLATSTLERIKPFLVNEPDLYFELGQSYLSVNKFEKARINFNVASSLSDVYKKNSEMYLRLIEEKTKK